MFFALEGFEGFVCLYVCFVSMCVSVCFCVLSPDVNVSVRDQVWPGRVREHHCQTFREVTSMRNHHGKSLCCTVLIVCFKLFIKLPITCQVKSRELLGNRHTYESNCYGSLFEPSTLDL